VDSGKQLRRFGHGEGAPDDPPVTGITFAPDGKTLAVVTSNAADIVKICKTADGSEQRRLPLSKRYLDSAFSPNGELLAIAERDDNVAEALGSRPDFPADMLQHLLARASETVRARLSKSVSAQVRERVQTALAGAPAQTMDARASAPNDYIEAKAAVIVLNKGGKLNDSSVNRFAIRREYPNVIAALSLLSGGSVEVIAQLMEEESGSGLIVACRGSRLNWQTTLAILDNRRVPPLPKPQLAQLKEVFDMLYVSAAQYTIRFEPPVKVETTSGSNDRVAAGGHR
jgi:hypothetical protein